MSLSSLTIGNGLRVGRLALERDHEETDLYNSHHHNAFRSGQV